MDITNQKVMHKTWGAGTVISYNHPYFKVQFQKETKLFHLSQSFCEVMVFEDGDVQKQVLLMIAQKEQADREERETWVRKPVAQATEVRRNTTAAKIRLPRKIERPNIVFKCNYCDGGENERHIGYRAPCSDKVIRYNIDHAHHSWCSDETCPCRQYLDGEIDVFELEQIFRDGGMVCYESKMLTDWAAFAGMVLKGDRKNEPKKIRNVQLNSLAVLTTRKPYADESDRFVFGVFLVGDADEGSSLDAGFVQCTSEYHIELSPKEAEQIKFWNYHANDTIPERAVWGQGLYRYTNDIEAVQILRDIAKIKTNPAEKAFAEAFLAHFCQMKRIQIEDIPAPNGALMR